MQELRLRHKGAAALNPVEQALTFQLRQRLAQRGPADPKRGGEFSLCRQAVADRVTSGLNPGAQRFHNLTVAVFGHCRPPFILQYTSEQNICKY